MSTRLAHTPTQAPAISGATLPAFQPFGHDALQPHLAGMNEHGQAVVLREPAAQCLAIATPIWEVNRKIHFLDV